MNPQSVQNDVRKFYDRVGWKEISEGVYQNAQYEDLRPVSHLYIHRCHLRVNRHIPKEGRYILDAGSGPIQYPEYLTYSENFNYRVCLDISIVALKDARKRLGSYGFYVVGDIAQLPFQEDAFDGVVSLHTIHHVPENAYLRAYQELKRVLSPGKKAVVVNGWKQSGFMDVFGYPILLMERLLKKPSEPSEKLPENEGMDGVASRKPQGTFVKKLDAKALRNLLRNDMKIEIKVWRSVSVRFLRALIHPWALGRFWLGLLYLLEEVFPNYFGEKGQYPLIIFEKEII